MAKQTNANSGPMLLVELKTDAAGKKAGDTLRATQLELNAAGLKNGKHYVPRGTYPNERRPASDLVQTRQATDAGNKDSSNNKS